MRVAFYIPNMHRHAGAERMVSLLANNLTKDPHYEIYLFEKKYTGKSAFPLNPNIRHLAISHAGDERQLYRGLFTVLKLAHLLREFKINVLIISDSYKTYLPLIACQLAGIKSIVWEHFSSSLRTHANGHRSLGREISLWCTSKIATTVVSLTQKDKELWLRKLKPRGKVISIPNMIGETIKNDYDPHSKIILAIGRLTPQKGFDWLLQIWQQLISYNPRTQWKLLIIGKKDDNSSYSDDLMRTCHTTPNVEIREPTSKIGMYYAKAGIFVLPSRFEGLPLVLIEAQACGIPAVAFDCLTGPSEIIKQNKSGFLIPPFDKEAFCEALQTLMRSSTLREEFSSQAKRQGELFFPENIIPKWLRLLNSLK